jgi:hypothetical protein
MSWLAEKREAWQAGRAERHWRAGAQPGSGGERARFVALDKEMAADMARVEAQAQEIEEGQRLEDLREAARQEGLIASVVNSQTWKETDTQAARKALEASRSDPEAEAGA